jgi:ferredoxin
MKFYIDEDLGTGCGVCEEMCPEVFKVDEKN